MSAPQSDNPTTPVAVPVSLRPADSQPGVRWRRYSLRTLLILMTAVACFTGWIMYQIREREASLELVLLRGGSTSISFQGRKPAPSRTAWLTRVSWFKPVHTIGIEMGELTPAEMERVRRAFPEAEIVEYMTNIHLLPSSIPPMGLNS